MSLVGMAAVLFYKSLDTVVRWLWLGTVAYCDGGALGR